MAIQKVEGGDGEILLAAVLLHDCVPPSPPLAGPAPTTLLAADRARSVLTELGWQTERVRAVVWAIETLDPASDTVPDTIESRILKDADDLDAIGMIGVARCFYAAGRNGLSLYDPGDPGADHRSYNHTRYAIDHFGARLFRPADSYATRTGRQMAAARLAKLRAFYDAFLEEAEADDGGEDDIATIKAVS